MSKLSYAIIGAGALGAYYGARLAHAGAEVHFLCRRDFNHVQKNGLRIESMHGDFNLPAVRAYREPADLPRCDVAIIGLKTVHNDQLPALLPWAVKDTGVALVLQNGLSPERAAADIVGEDRVIGGLCFLCSNRIGPGHIRQTRFDHVKIGPLGRHAMTDRLTQIASDFEKASIQIQVTDDLALARWQKLVWNVPYNGLAAVRQVDTEQLMSDPQTLALVTELMHEVAAAARAVGGHVIEKSFIEKMLDNTRRMGPYKPSMQIDRQAGRVMEVEAIHGDPVRAAQAVGGHVPQMHRLYEQLHAINQQLTP